MNVPKKTVHNDVSSDNKTDEPANILKDQTLYSPSDLEQSAKEGSEVSSASFESPDDEMNTSLTSGNQGQNESSYDEVEKENRDEESNFNALASEYDTHDIPADFETNNAAESSSLPLENAAEKEVDKASLSSERPWQEGPLLSEAFSLKSAIEAILFATQKPMKPHEILELLQDPRLSTRDISSVLDSLSEFYTLHVGGFRLEYIKNQGYQFRTAPEAAALMERMFAKRPRTLSRAALETLAIVSYKQPLTRAEIEFIRGVDVASALKVLVDRGLVTSVGRKQDPGRPLLFGTTDEFLRVYGFQTLKDLPSLDSLQVNQEIIETAENKIRAFQQGENVQVEEFVSGEPQETRAPSLDENTENQIWDEARE